ncbi:amino acid ABC transporter substrate-binding protein (PAAT family) [Amycolatopsis sulphurea]|uniref:Amino acid ABC transporter substrate-binding protein (PAAT family) n=1 Tax=Amycolatopsis sulphurea TaxID=76022 RepID=A0A2A9FBF2_9PSEU|nr:glutamate ABC transporter substrate-binding protein [Amycolatopsis sulphurea]PFG47882.1 amino acid ABC transporter substrate-binding protein (PAAT family) [Amycolatopsis sulphurea]
MIRSRHFVRAAALAAVVLFSAACTAAEVPADPTAVTDAAWPTPAGVGGPDTSAGVNTDTSCDPLASIRPTAGTSVPPGSHLAEIKARGKLIAGVDQTTYLFGFRNPQSGNLEGFDIDVVNQIARALFGTAEGHVQFRAIPSSQREQVLKDHKVDVVVRTYSITCSRRKEVQFSSVYYVAGQKILVPKTSNAQSLADLAGKRVCAARKSTSLTKVATDPAKPIAVSVPNWSDCLVMLQQNQVEAVSTDDTILAGMAAQDPQVKVVGDQLTKENYGVGVPLDEQDVVQFVNAVLDQMRADGSWAASYDKWVGRRLGPASPPEAQYR